MIHLDDTTVKRLRVLQRSHKDKRVFVKATVLLMLHQGCTPQFVAESLGIDDSTVYRYCQGYEEFGLEDYLRSYFVAYSGQLTTADKEYRTGFTNLYIVDDYPKTCKNYCCSSFICLNSDLIFVNILIITKIIL